MKQKLSKRSRSHDQHGTHSHIWLNPLNIFCSEKRWRNVLKLGMYHTWSTWHSLQYMVKPLKYLLLRNTLTERLETWYVSYGTGGLPTFFKWWPRPFFGKVKVAFRCFYMEKCYNRRFHELCITIRFGTKVNWVHEHSNIRGQGHSLTLNQRLSYFDKFKATGLIVTQFIYMYSLQGLGWAEKGPGHITDMAAHLYMVKFYKNLLLQNQLNDGLEIWYAAFGIDVLLRL